MSNKRITVSSDGGTTQYTLPGNTGDLKVSMKSITDTVFGQTFESQQPDLAGWTIGANGIFKGVAGYNIAIKKGGTPTTMTGEACSLVSTRVYQITNAAHRVISYLDALTVLDGVTDVTAQVLSIDYLTGTITFKGTYTVVGSITVTGKYIPLTVMAKAKQFTLTQTTATTEASCYDDAQATSGFATMLPSLKKVNLSVNHVFAASNLWLTTLLAKGIAYIEIDLDVSNPGVNVARGFFKIADDAMSGKQGDVELEDITFQLWVPDGSLVAFPFNWYFGSGSKLNTAIQMTLNAWIAATNLTVTYLPAGTQGNSPADGRQGLGFPTTCTLTNSVDGLNEFSFTYTGVAQLTAV